MDRAKFDEAIASVEAAEKMAPAGSHEQAMLVKAALYNAWPVIRAFANCPPLMPVYGSREASPE